MKFKFSVFYFFFTSILMLQCGIFDPSYFSESNDFHNGANKSLTPPEDGACYTKCLIDPKFILEEKDVYVYTGQDFQIEGIQKELFILSEKRTKWIKKKADKNCLSANPEDCLVWCLVEVPGESIELNVVQDTSKVKDYVIETMMFYSYSESSEFFEWRKVLCEAELTSVVIEQLSMKLKESSFYTGEIVEKFNSTLALALKEYQKKYELPIGGINFETLDQMGIVY